MNSGFWAFLKKECTELWRSGRLVILLAIFVLFGIMNPAIAKLTPWLMEQMAEELAGSGLSVSAVTVDASTSFAQFFKNIPMALVIFIVLFGASLTNECGKGTLIPLLTRGLSRQAVVTVKGIVMVLVWTLGYWLCFGITLGYTIYFWGGEKMARYALAAIFPYLFGLWLIAMLLVVSVVARSGTGVLAGIVGLVAACFLFGLLPGVARWLPINLMSAQDFAVGQEEISEFARAAVVAGISGVAGYIGAVIGFGKKII
ncbi:MAG: ABC transporter permease subunit [Lachnospiraceae bacterium]|nr:ABC transporter permease subunit [Lachnospiraceae bacterium]